MNFFQSILLFLLCCIFQNSNAQTVGVINSTAESFEGYTFFSPFSSTNAYLVDNCGRLINQWDRGTRPGLSAYILENGLMLRTYKVPPLGPFTSASNAGGLELVDWDNNTIWSYELNTSTWLSHHDAVMMPNGNILLLSWEIISEADLIQLGRDPDEIDLEGFAWNETIIEIEPLGTNEINIVWEWRIRDHYIQDFDASKDNFGVVAEHPELFNINLPDITSSNSHSNFDYNHFNAIDYNASLDQILISVRNSDEIWMLDHSTTTAEAASHTGGNAEKGGDILYRYGNANAYDRGPVSAQNLFGQHGVNWIPAGDVDAGKILIYNNGNGRPEGNYSETEIIVPPMDANGNYIVPATAPFGPSEPEWSYGNASDEFYYSPYFSNAQRLPNGHTLINAGTIGNIYEVDAGKNIHWHYIIPLNGNNPVTQGSNANNNGTFRAYRYGLEYPGFAGLDLTPGELLENDNSPSNCQLVNTDELNNFEPELIQAIYDHESAQILIQSPAELQFQLSLIGMDGKYLMAPQNLSGNVSLPISASHSGYFLLRILAENGWNSTQKIFIAGY